MTCESMSMRTLNCLDYCTMRTVCYGSLYVQLTDALCVFYAFAWRIVFGFYFLVLCAHPHLCYRDNVDDFIAAHRLSDMLVKVNLDESASRAQGSTVGPPPSQTRSVHGHPSEIGTGKKKNV